MNDEHPEIEEEQWDRGLRSAFRAGAYSTDSILASLPPDQRPREPLSLRGNTPPAGARVPQSTLGRLQVLEEIARGGVGVIYRAHDPDLGRDVALKVLHEELADDDQLVRRFIEEAQIGGQLQHPGIVPVHEIGLGPDQRPYFAMKLVEGRTLAALLRTRGNGRDLPRLLRIFAQVCDTVAYAHSRGVVHRDLKPANVMVGAFGEVQVMDWGFAKVLADRAAEDAAGAAGAAVATVRSAGMGQSEAGSAFGTPSYMAPEQARGEIDRIGAPTDVFALGAILLEILTGRPPYPASGGLALAARADLQPAQQALASARADDALRTLVQRCLELDPAQRPASAGALAAAMTGHFEATEERARQAEIAAAAAHARAASEHRARRLTVLLSLSVVGLITVIGTFSWLSSLETARVNEQLAALRSTADRAIDDGEVESARAALSKAEALASTLPAPPETVAAITALRQRLDDLQRDLELRDTLYVVCAEPGRHEQLERDLETALARYGVALDATPAGSLAEGLRALRSGVTGDIARAFEHLALTRGEGRVPPPRWPYLDLADQIDPDLVRGKIRGLIRSVDGAALRTLASEIDATAVSADTLVLLAKALSATVGDAAALALLDPAVEQHMDDLWIHVELSRLFQGQRPPDHERARRHGELARMLHPDTAWRPAPVRRGSPRGRRPMRDRRGPPGGRFGSQGELQRARRQLERGDHDGMLETLRALVAEQPHDRRVQAVVRDALDRLGDRDPRLSTELRALRR